MTTAQKPIGLLGGTFDPVHHGHLRLALELYEKLGLAEVRLIPSAIPPHRHPPLASPQMRLAMIQIAIQGVKGLTLDDREFYRTGPSYTIHTLESLRADFTIQPLCLILGMDAFLNLPNWYQWERLMTLTHLVVVRRASAVLPETHDLQHFLHIHQLHDQEELTQNRAGGIWIEEITQLTISATQIRNLLATHKNPRYLLPHSVLNFIHTHQLYR